MTLAQILRMDCDVGSRIAIVAETEVRVPLVLLLLVPDQELMCSGRPLPLRALVYSEVVAADLDC